MTVSQNSNRKLTVFKPFKTDYPFADKAVRSDAAAELDRLTRGTQKKASNSGHNSMENNSLNNSSSECWERCQQLKRLNRFQTVLFIPFGDGDFTQKNCASSSS